MYVGGVKVSKKIHVAMSAADTGERVKDEVLSEDFDTVFVGSMIFVFARSVATAVD